MLLLSTRTNYIFYKTMTNSFSLFRKVAFLEGISFLVLLSIAMPLKYFANMPMPVRIVGGLHGGLFVAFVVLALIVVFSLKKSFFWLFKAVVGSFLPFGTFYMDREWKRQQKNETKV
jgi:integral membrane protein